MKLVTYTLTRFQGNDFGQGVYSILHYGVVKHPICAPAALFVHGSGSNRVNERLQRFALLFVAHQNTVGTCSHYSVIYSIYEKRNIKLVNGMDIGTIGTQRGVSQSMVVECSRKGVPCPKVFPLAIVGYDCHRLSLLGHLVVKAYFGQLAVVAENLFERVGIYVLAQYPGHITQLKGENTSVPQSPFTQ